jgi:predicted nucleic acid-binding protein
MTIPTDPSLVKAAVALSQSARLSLWDALIVEAASTAGCDRILTEDLRHGARIGEVRIENPFAVQSRPTALE